MPPLGPDKTITFLQSFEKETTEHREALKAELAKHNEVKEAADVIARAYGLEQYEDTPYIENPKLRSEDGTKVAYNLGRGYNYYTIEVETSWPDPENSGLRVHSSRTAAYIDAPVTFVDTERGGRQTKVRGVVGGEISGASVMGYEPLAAALSSNSELFQDIKDTLSFMGQHLPETNGPISPEITTEIGGVATSAVAEVG